MEKTRHFIVDTPVGQLAIYAKHDKTDCAADYPGVFIDYVRKDGATAILACVGIRFKQGSTSDCCLRQLCI